MTVNVIVNILRNIIPEKQGPCRPVMNNRREPTINTDRLARRILPSFCSTNLG